MCECVCVEAGKSDQIVFSYATHVADMFSKMTIRKDITIKDMFHTLFRRNMFC